MKKFIAAILTVIMAVTAMTSVSAASDNNPWKFDTKEAVAKWKLAGKEALGAEYFEADAGKNGGALKLTGDNLSGVKIIVLAKSVNIPKGSNVTISFDMKSNTPISDGQGGGKRVVVRLESNDNLRTCKQNPGDGTWVNTSVRYEGNAAGNRDKTKNNVDKDYVTVEIVTFNLAAGDVIYIDNINFTDDSGKTYLLDSMLDGSGDNPGTADPMAVVAVMAVCVVPVVTAAVRKKKNR